MKTYLDTSILVSAIHLDDHSSRVTAWLASTDVIWSRWALTEISSALAVQVRMGRLADKARRGLEIRLDAWLGGREVIDVLNEDVVLARDLVRGDVRLRAPDALHLAIALREGLPLATLDRDMAAAARDAGLVVLTP
ncbi:MAG: type II toxin-antitoxin system VapC family toxin [Brevundimonas sp.]|uniref:type II toxin-antitoxin system VapC family toxin n=1 Tax=Brevundimonas sp. TaxID=1871086 RepID=UPI0025BA4FE8|nr:type II toxin-antitoxin system VapC family toxin [Brevundimonas sp.]MBX3476935.1 type II toxin-antitoxin system VapC family toxin [Brevundimonas sp.]